MRLHPSLTPWNNKDRRTVLPHLAEDTGDTELRRQRWVTTPRTAGASEVAEVTSGLPATLKVGTSALLPFGPRASWMRVGSTLAMSWSMVTCGGHRKILCILTSE